MFKHWFKPKVTAGLVPGLTEPRTRLCLSHYSESVYAFVRYKQIPHPLTVPERWIYLQQSSSASLWHQQVWKHLAKREEGLDAEKMREREQRSTPIKTNLLDRVAPLPAQNKDVEPVYKVWNLPTSLRR